MPELLAIFVATFFTMVGVSLIAVGFKTLYARLNLDPVRESMATATRAMFEVGGMIQREKGSASAPRNAARTGLDKPEQLNLSLPENSNIDILEGAERTCHRRR